MLEDQAFYAKNVEPLYYYWCLFLSVLCWLFAANWYLVLLMPMISDANVNLLDYFSKWIEHLNSQLVGIIDLTFINALIFFLLFIYLQAVSRKGNETLGYRFATFTFYSTEPNETLAEAFIFNALLNCALQAAIVQYLLESMTFYAAGSNALLISYRIKYSSMMIYYDEKVNMFSFLLLFFSAITVISLVYQGANRINFTDKKKTDAKPKKNEQLLPE